MGQSILDAFNQYFEMVPTTSEDLKNEAYKLRFQIYCNETSFENPRLYPNGMEYDNFDNCSIHYLIRHRNSNTYAATTRLIQFDQYNPDWLFPIEIHCEINSSDLLKNIPRDKIAEVSRFCVSKEFKRRKIELGSLTGFSLHSMNYISDEERRTFPHISLALIACMIKISKEQNIEYWYAVMEPALFRFLSTMGINFTGIGPIIEYHGKRSPSIIKVSDLLHGVFKKNPLLWQMLTNDGQIIF